MIIHSLYNDNCIHLCGLQCVWFAEYCLNGGSIGSFSPGATQCSAPVIKVIVGRR